MSRRFLSIPLACVAFAVGPAHAQEEFAASGLIHCAIDILTHCSEAEPGGGRIVKCLQQKRADLTPECRGAVTPTDFDDTTQGLQIVVTVDQLKSTQGVLIVMLSEDADRFPTMAKRTVIAPIDGESLTVRFRHLKPGTYAVTVLHDLDEDSRFSAGEGFAASNGVIGRPTFAASALKIDENTTIAIAMRYPMGG